MDLHNSIFNEHSNRKAEVRVRTPDGAQSRVRMLQRLPNSEVVCIPGAVSLGSTLQLLVRCLAGQLAILSDQLVVKSWFSAQWGVRHVSSLGDFGEDTHTHM